MAPANRLAAETSPYLRQHVENPVEWHPWGDEALDLAKALDRPLFVSIGYAACHWCHVMAHESFEDEATAGLINAHFVAIKVDREERPDLDAVYLEAVQALTGRGGWPLSVFCTPDGRPFFGGTYFPPRPMPGTPSFTSVLEAVERAWRERRQLVGAQADELTAAIGERLAPPAAEEGSSFLGSALREAAMDRFAAIFDPEHGGVGGAPKFPQPPMLELVLRAHLHGDGRALPMLERTLASMAAGGIYDHLEGGFARYSVDAAWQVPHFEKMLYDQAQLAPLYLHAFQVTGDERWRQVAKETLDYALTKLAVPGGGFAASEDADSEGEEGRFSTWTPSELAEALGADDAVRAAAAYGVSERGNFEHGRSVLHRPPGEILRDAGLEELRARLAAFRGRRVRPGRDDKAITEWNAMVCSALAQAALALSSEPYRRAAVHCAEFLLAELLGEDGRWRRSFRSGRASQLAVAADYAWLVDAFTRLGEATGEARWTEEARRAAAGLVRLFSAEDGGWYTTGSDAEALVVRPRETYDGVTPAAASVAAVALARLGALLGDEAMTERARRSVQAAGTALLSSPLAFPHLVLAAELLEAGPVEVVVTGERPDLVASVGARYLPSAVLAWGEPTSSPLFAGREGPLAWVCRRGTCLAPVSEVGPLLASLGVAESAA